MPVAYEAIFTPSKKALDELVLSSYSVLTESGLGFQNMVWKLSPVNGTPEVSSHQPVTVDSIEEVPAATRRWWGRSLEWFSSKVGEVFFRIFKADPEGYNLIYNEGSRIHRMRAQDEGLQAELLSMLLRLSDVFQSDLCVYKSQSTDWFQVPTREDLRTALEQGPKWDGDVLIFSAEMIDPELEGLIAKSEVPVKMATTGKYVVNYFGAHRTA